MNEKLKTQDIPSQHLEQLFDCSPGEIVQIDVTPMVAESNTVYVVAKTQVPWLQAIAYGTLTAIALTSVFLFGIQYGMKITPPNATTTTQPH